WSLRSCRWSSSGGPFGGGGSQSGRSVVIRGSASAPTATPRTLGSPMVRRRWSVLCLQMVRWHGLVSEQYTEIRVDVFNEYETRRRSSVAIARCPPRRGGSGDPARAQRERPDLQSGPGPRVGLAASTCSGRLKALRER